MMLGRPKGEVRRDRGLGQESPKSKPRGVESGQGQPNPSMAKDIDLFLA
jgi:hypothetical protein